MKMKPSNRHIDDRSRLWTTSCDQRKKNRANNRFELVAFGVESGASSYSVHQKQFLVKSNRFICKSLSEFPSNSRKWNATHTHTGFSNLVHSYHLQRRFMRHFCQCHKWDDEMTSIQIFCVIFDAIVELNRKYPIFWEKGYDLIFSGFRTHRVWLWWWCC